MNRGVVRCYTGMLESTFGDCDFCNYPAPVSGLSPN